MHRIFEEFVVVLQPLLAYIPYGLGGNSCEKWFHTVFPVPQSMFIPITVGADPNQAHATLEIPLQADRKDSLRVLLRVLFAQIDECMERYASITTE